LEGRDVPSTCVVSSLGDTGVGVATDHGDLRFCLSQANARPGEDLIIFSVTGTINLTKALPDITDDLIIAGPGADQLMVRRDTGGTYRIFTIAKGVAAQIFSLTVSNGMSDHGGGVRNSGALTLGGAVITANYYTPPYEGPGGIENEPGAVLTVLSSSVSANGGTSGGVTNYGMLVVSSSTLAGNGGGGLFNDGDAFITDSTVAGNAGSGIAANSGTMTIERSTIADNRTWDSGGGLVLGKNSVIRDSTVSGNSAQGGGGGIVTADGVVIEFCTIAGNTAGASGGGINAIYGQPIMRDTIVAGNSAGQKGPDMKGGLKSSAYNLFGNIADIYGYSDTDLYNVDPLLGPLRDNGGPTLTMALLPGSPAIDSGDNTNAPDWDQRGPGYPRIVNRTIDRGAFEVQNTTGPTGGRSILATSARPAMAALAMPQPAPAVAPHEQPPAAPAPAAAPGTAGKAATLFLYLGHPPAALPDADPLGLGW
jgi:hypothetical protein